ncbi:Abi-alpha family protein [Enterococcus sp. 2201sp1_2201st1_B8_2201SCRN_220225]|uniref:Abi-alpha family protein n=1 Tax=unclassified Enterococcus TaxID=2608891 RepID=UPI0034A0D8D3
MDFKINMDLPLSKDTVSNILEPTLIPLSKALGGIIQWVFQKPIEYGVIRPIQLENLKTRTEIELSLIPEKNRTPEKLGLTLKAFEDSRYQLDSEILVEFFAKLIAGTVDNRSEINPVYSSILSEMSEDDAHLLNYFFNRNYLFENQITHSNPAFSDERYRLRSKMNYYKITGDYEEGYHRPSDNWPSLLKDNIVLDDIENSFLFLKSKGLIFQDFSQDSHVLIQTIEENSFKTNDWLKDLLDRFSNYRYNRITTQETTVYSLTSLGRSLADLVCHKD